MHTHHRRPSPKLAALALLLAASASAGAALAAAPDFKLSTDGSDPAKWDPKTEATISAPGNHNVLYTDENIRIIRVTVPPGTREPLHMHRYCSVLVLDQVPPNIKDFDASGKENAQQAPYNHISNPLVAVQQPNAPHSIDNRDTVPVKLVRIEFLHQLGPCSWDAPDLERGARPNLTTLK